jgi:DNA topoisomerase-3
LTKPNWSSTAGCWTRRRTHRWVMNEAQYKGEVNACGFHPNHRSHQRRFQNLNHPQTTIIYTTPDFPELLATGWYECHAIVHRKTWRIQTSFVYWRVQTPTLAMVVDRFKEIKNFKPQPYWELQTVYRDTLFSYEEGVFWKGRWWNFANKVKKVNSKLFLSKKNGNEFAPKLFDLTGLQVYCNTKFGFTADETLKIVQTLYEQKWSPTQSRYHILPNDIYPSTGIWKT